MATEDPSSGAAGVCAICEGPGATLSCTGACSRSFHDACTTAPTEGSEKEWRCGRCPKISVGVVIVYVCVCHRPAVLQAKCK